MLRGTALTALAALSWALAFHLGSTHAQAKVARQSVVAMSVTNTAVVVMSGSGDLFTLDLNEVRSGKEPVRIGNFWGEAKR